MQKIKRRYFMTQSELVALKTKLKEYIEDYPFMNNTKLATLFLDENDVPLTVRSIRRYLSLIKEADRDLQESVSDEVGFEEDSDVTISPVSLLDDTDLSISLGKQGLESEALHDLKPAEPEADDTSAPEIDKDCVVENVGRIGEDEPIETTIDEVAAAGQFDGGETKEYIPTRTISITYSGKIYSVEQQEVDLIYCGFSKYGLNLTKAELQTVLDKSYAEIQMVISKFKIYKESEPYSEWAKRKMDEAELFDYITSNAELLLSRLHENDGSIMTTIIRKYKKQLFKLQNQELEFKLLFNDLKEELQQLGPPNGWREEMTQITAFDLEIESPIHVFIPDMHIGMNQSNYNLEIIEEKLRGIVVDLIPMKKIYLYFMGDIIHSVSGLNHKDNWKAMAQGTSGAEAIIAPFKLLRDFITNIPGLAGVYIVGGEQIAALKRA